jgi:hypothetical protein
MESQRGSSEPLDPAEGAKEAKKLSKRIRLTDSIYNRAQSICQLEYFEESYSLLCTSSITIEQNEVRFADD